MRINLEIQKKIMLLLILLIGDHQTPRHIDEQQPF